ncbi:MAG: hypothetical protein ACD_79C00590G0004, partial [uncultured bacterium]
MKCNKGISNLGLIITILIAGGFLFFVFPKLAGKVKVTTSRNSGQNQESVEKQEKVIPYATAYNVGTSRAKDIVEKSKERIK